MPIGPRLVLLREGRAEAVYPISGRSLTIGRSPRCDVVLSDERVSKTHAQISTVSGEFVLRDLGSRNGTRVNEHKIRSHALISGDLIRVGRVCFVFLRTEPEIQRDERNAVGWIVVGPKGHPIMKLPITEVPILIGSAGEVDIRVPERESPHFMAQILSVPTGVQITNLCSPWPHCSMLVDGTEMRFGSLRVECIEVERPDVQPTGFAPLATAVSGSSAEEAEDAPTAGGGSLGEESLLRALAEEVERAEREVALTPDSTEQTSAPAPHRVGGCRLTATSGPAKGTSFTVTTKPLVIGCHARCDITLVDPRVSRRHARLMRTEGDTIIEDLDSHYGVYVNGKRIRRKPLHPGDVIAIGSSEFLVHL